jgi:hypothetical protein
MPKVIENIEGIEGLWYSGDEIESVIITADHRMQVFVKDLGMYEFSLSSTVAKYTPGAMLNVEPGSKTTTTTN